MPVEAGVDDAAVELGVVVSVVGGATNAVEFGAVVTGVSTGRTSGDRASVVVATLGIVVAGGRVVAATTAASADAGT
jgi:hypothetical protein